MKKIYLLLLLVSVGTASVNAQKKYVKFPADLKVGNTAGPARRQPFVFPQSGIATSCFKVNLPAPASWGSPVTYIFDSKNPIDSGFVTGTNMYDFPAIAQYFDESSTSYNYITEAFIGFGNAFSDFDSAFVNINVYDGTAGTAPGRLIGSSILYLKDFADNANTGKYTDVTFSTPVQLPASKKFFIAVDMSDLSWYYTPADTLSVVSSQVNKGTGAWAKYYTDNTGSTAWGAYKSLFTNFDVALYIHPFLSATTTCDALPVHLVSFTGEAKGKSALLNWQVTQEVDMKQYVIERAVNGLQFIPAGTVAATNSPLGHSYSFVDADGLSAGSTLYYRLRQVNNDGKVSYSNTVILPGTTGALSVKVVNPFKTAVQLQINAPSAQKMQGAVYDMLGRKIVAVKEQDLAAGQNAVTIPTGLLPKGAYILNITVGKTTYKYKILN